MVVGYKGKDRILHLPFAVDWIGLSWIGDSQQILHRFVYLGVLETVEVNLRGFKV